MSTAEHRAPRPTHRPFILDETDQLRQRLTAFARLLDAAERGGATVMRIKDIRRAFQIGAQR